MGKLSLLQNKHIFIDVGGRKVEKPQKQMAGEIEEGERFASTHSREKITNFVNVRRDRFFYF